MSTEVGADQINWYHTIDLGDGVRTPGDFDTEAALAMLPFPASLEGKRCLDVGTRDGFWAFSMEKRGAAEVVAIDIDHPLDLDNPWYPDAVRQKLADAPAGEEARGFHFAHAALGSRVKRVTTSIYDLDPEIIGTFDFAYMGTMLLHLRDPIGALMALRRVVTGQLLLNDSVAVRLRPFHDRTPRARLLEASRGPFWWIPNPPALRRYAEAGGFRAVEGPTLYTLKIDDRERPNPYRQRGGVTRIEWLRNYARRGVPHAWLLLEPNLE